MLSKPTTLYRITMAHCAYVLADSPDSAITDFSALLNPRVNGIDPFSLFTTTRVLASDSALGWGNDEQWTLTHGRDPITVAAFLEENPDGTRGEDAKGAAGGQQRGEGSEEDPCGGARGEMGESGGENA